MPLNKDGSVIIKLKDTSPEDVKMWALGYGFGCEILSPQSLRDKMKKSDVQPKTERQIFCMEE